MTDSLETRVREILHQMIYGDRIHQPLPLDIYLAPKITRALEAALAAVRCYTLDDIVEPDTNDCADAFIAAFGTEAG